jgi:hypothetical protein
MITAKKQNYTKLPEPLNNENRESDTTVTQELVVVMLQKTTKRESYTRERNLALMPCIQSCATQCNTAVDYSRNLGSSDHMGKSLTDVHSAAL